MQNQILSIRWVAAVIIQILDEISTFRVDAKPDVSEIENITLLINGTEKFF